MGAAASSLPSKLSEEDLQHILNDMFNSFKDSDGLIDKELLIKAAYSGQEQEVFELYNKFAKNGLMDAKGFHDFCILTKLLNRTNFTVADSVRIFQKSITTLSINQGSSIQSINYPIFRKFILNDIAELKLIHIDNLIFKLSRIEANTPRLVPPEKNEVVIKTEEQENQPNNDNNNNNNNNNKVKKGNKNKTTNDEEFDYGVPIIDVTEDEGVDDQDVLSPPLTNKKIGTPVENSAAIRIQSFSRMKTASRYVNELREINSLHSLKENETIESELSIPIQSNVPIEESKHQNQTQNQTQFCNNSNQSNPIIEVYYNQFTILNHPGQMDLTRFIKLCHDCSLISRKFTVVDAELAFLRAKKKASISNISKYRNGVFYDKRINFIVFREILLRCIVEKMNEPIDYILHKIINAAKR